MEEYFKSNPADHIRYTRVANEMMEFALKLMTGANPDKMEYASRVIQLSQWELYKPIQDAQLKLRDENKVMINKKDN